MPTYEIEICGNKNENYRFAPLSLNLRGRWSPSGASGHAHQAIEDLHQVCSLHGGYIPGIVIFVDTDKRIGGYYDPLIETAKGKSLWEAIKVILESFKELFGQGSKPWPNFKRELNIDGIKSWLCMMRQAMDGGIARQTETSTEIPSFKDLCEIEGRRRRGYVRRSEDLDGRPKWDPWVDKVEKGKGKKLVGAVAGSSDGGGEASQSSRSGR